MSKWYRHKKVDFWRRYVEAKNPNADLAPRATGRLFQGGPTTGIREPELG